MNIVAHTNEQKAAKAFSNQSLVFDEIYRSNTIVHYKRERVRKHLLQFLQTGQRVLELNSGTGEDAIWMAANSFSVHATDIAEGMQQQLKQKVQDKSLSSLVTQELCSFTELQNLEDKGPYHYIFSNFAGLNCSGELPKILSSFDELLLPGGYVTLVILPKFCLWELLLVFKGKWKTATRRLFHKKTLAHVEGEYFDCWYYNPSYVKKHIGSSFKIVDLQGLCTIVPPSYIEGFAEKYPRVFKFLSGKEKKWSGAWPWRSIGDYYIISFQKK